MDSTLPFARSGRRSEARVDAELNGASVREPAAIAVADRFEALGFASSPFGEFAFVVKRRVTEKNSAGLYDQQLKIGRTEVDVLRKTELFAPSPTGPLAWVSE